ncbi:MAG TPA: helix-turn-helix transcriptional regulator [Candidatus Gastranaerophilales bacterium]|nr:helix-turn-helix transcriptional regulator [Candidatus Gastranaerophilales bacterium]
MKDIKVLLGKRIREIRKSQNLTQEALAELIGVESPSISNIENGKYYPTNENLQKIAEVLKVKPYELYMFEHLRPADELKDEMFQALDNNEKLTRLMYKFFVTIK